MARHRGESQDSNRRRFSGRTSFCVLFFGDFLGILGERFRCGNESIALALGFEIGSSKRSSYLKLSLIRTTSRESFHVEEF